ncbi:hypothetical protein B0H14DRAFT_2389675, partial [Mycena olivaceomarginata]
GDDWAALVDVWWALEASWVFASSTKSHPTTNRPKAVGAWVKNARNGIPAIGTADAMDSEWWKWWTAINPGWRVSDGELLQDGDGSLDALRCPEQNGFLNVIACLKWWFLAMDIPSESWKRAVADVQWVIGKMLDA